MTQLADFEVQPRAQQALSESPVYALRRIHVTQEGDALRLSGHVACFYHKQMAQEIVRLVAEGLQVVNHIEVA